MSVFKRYKQARARARLVENLRRQAERPDGEAERATIEAAGRKQLVFALSSGRAGTETLCRLFGELDAVCATHEPKPQFEIAMRPALSEPELARAFLVHHKLPAINSTLEPIYVETSHIFGKAFLPAMLALGLRPRLIVTHRAPRLIAKSFQRIRSTPHRTQVGKLYLLSPGDASLLPVLRWDDFSDYQLCYWYALETQRRQAVLRRHAQAHGCICVDVDTNDLSRLEQFVDLFDALLPDRALSAAEIARIGGAIGVRHNVFAKYAESGRAADTDYDAEEELVLARVREVTPDFSPE